MTINDGNGLFDKCGLIDSIIIDLDSLEVKGIANMRIVFETVQKLAALKNGIKEEETHADDHHQ